MYADAPTDSDHREPTDLPRPSALFVAVALIVVYFVFLRD
jgi:hypothetical protein